MGPVPRATRTTLFSRLTPQRRPPFVQPCRPNWPCSHRREAAGGASAVNTASAPVGGDDRGGLLWRGWSAEATVRQSPCLSLAQVRALPACYLEQLSEIETPLSSEYREAESWKQGIHKPTSLAAFKEARADRWPSASMPMLMYPGR